ASVLSIPKFVPSGLQNADELRNRDTSPGRAAPVQLSPSRGEVGASVARCPRTPPDAAKTSGLRSVFQTALRGLSNRSIVVVGNYEFGPITSEPSRAKARPLRPRRSYFAPAEARLAVRAWVEAPGTAPGSEGFIATAIYRHSRLTPASPIYARKVDEKRARY